jgi:hypothetical protein
LVHNPGSFDSPDAQSDLFYDLDKTTPQVRDYPFVADDMLGNFILWLAAICLCDFKFPP